MSFPPLPLPSSVLVLLLLLLLLSSSSSIALPSTDDPPPSSSPPFWLSSDLVSVDFRKGCLSTALCHQPAFKLVHTMTLNGERAVMSWPVNGGSGGAELVREQPRQFVSHWTIGDPEDVSVGCQIAGTDPSFGFARVCDEALARRVFQEAMVRKPMMNINNIHRVRRTGIIFDGGSSSSSSSSSSFSSSSSSLSSFPDDGIVDGDQQMVVEMRGRCFNATLVVRKHTQRCPWCPDPNVHIHVAAGNGEAAGLPGTDPQQSQRAAGNEADSVLLLHNILILALSGAVVFAVTGLFAVLVAQRRYRTRHAKGGRVKLANGGGNAEGGGRTPMMLGGGKRSKKRSWRMVTPPRGQRSMPVSPQGNRKRGRGEEEEDQKQQVIIYGGGSRTIGGGAGTRTEESADRYDTPWDNKYCLVPRQWLLSSGPRAPCPDPPVPVVSSALPLRPSHPLHHHLPPPPSDFCPSSLQQPRSPAMGLMSPARVLPDHPPPPPPPIPAPSVRHHLPHQPHHEQTFASPNTSSGSASRHDDSGLDSV